MGYKGEFFVTGGTTFATAEDFEHLLAKNEADEGNDNDNEDDVVHKKKRSKPQHKKQAKRARK